jgi:hypothetical protein
LSSSSLIAHHNSEVVGRVVIHIPPLINGSLFSNYTYH